MGLRLGCLGLLAAVCLGLAWPAAASAPRDGDPAAAAPGAGGAAPTAAAPGLGRLWAAPPERPDPSGEIAGLQLRRNLVNVVKAALAAGGAALLFVGLRLRRAGRQDAHRAVRDALLAALGFAGFWGWWNFLYLHFPDAVHANNVYVYYAGAKYFPELGYQRLYECTAVADFEAGFEERVRRRQLTSLESYELEGTGALLADPGRCTRHFSPARWAAFQHDVAWFRGRIEAQEWEAMQADHGYNPPPSWGLLGTPLAGSAPASEGQILALVLLDPLLDIAMWVCVWWAFGWRALCVALLYWGTNHTAEYGWTGGSFLRDDWLSATLIGICLLRRGHPTGAGFLIGCAALIRIFPALALLGVGAAALLRMAGERRIALRPEHLRLAVGALLAAAVVVPLSAFVAGGLSSWVEFIENTRLHVGTPANNLVGWKTLLSYDPDRRLADLLGVAADPSAAWKQARLETFESRRWLHAAGLLAYLLLLGRALLRQEDWVAAILGLGALLIVIEPTCYYTSILCAFGLLWTRRESIGVALLAVSAAQWAVAASFHPWDEIFAWQSVALVAFLVFATAAARQPLGRAEG